MSALAKVTKEKRRLERRAANLETAEKQFGGRQPPRRTIPSTVKGPLAMKNRQMAEAMANAANLELEHYRMPDKNMQAVAGTLVGIGVTQIGKGSNKG